MLFVQEQYRYLGASFKQQDYSVSQFAHQEFMLTLASSVCGQKCTVLGSLTAPADQALQLLLLLHTLYQSGAMQVTLFSPYLGYQRQDRLDRDISHGLQWADAMLHATGVQSVITIEAHNLQSLTTLKVPVASYSAEHVFEQEMVYFVSLGFDFVFPDIGASSRYHWILEKFPTAQQGFFLKKRSHNSIDVQAFQGKIGRKVIIYDDILDSGQTLLQVCIVLRHMGVEEIVIFVTHAFFHGQAWNDLWNLGVKMLYCTDSLPSAYRINHPKICIKSISHILKNIV